LIQTSESLIDTKALTKHSNRFKVKFMDQMGLTNHLLIEKYLVPSLEAEETKFFNEGKKRINVPALGIRHTALDTAFKLRGSYAPRDPKEAEHFGIKVVVLDMPRPPRTIDVAALEAEDDDE
jgi:hypothetical protein